MSQTTAKFPPPKVIAVDVDGTLRMKGIRNDKLIEWCRVKKAAGFDLILWSSRGRAHAVKVATEFECLDLFSAVISKPGYIVDDVGWRWIRFTRVVRGFTGGRGASEE